MQASAAINNEDQSEVERRHLRRARTVTQRPRTPRTSGVAQYNPCVNVKS